MVTHSHTHMSERRHTEAETDDHTRRGVDQGVQEGGHVTRRSSRTDRSGGDAALTRWSDSAEAW